MKQSKSRNLKSYLVIRIILIFSFMLMVMGSLFLYHKIETANIDKQIENAHSFADICQEQKAVFEKVRAEYKYENKIDIQTIKYLSSFLHESIEKEQSFFLDNKTEKFKQKYIDFHRKSEDLANDIKSLDNIKNLFEIDQLKDKNESLYIDALMISGDIKEYRKDFQLKVLVINVLFIVLSATVIIIISFRLGNEIISGINNSSTFVSNFSLENLEHKEVSDSRFEEFKSLKVQIMDMVNRLIIENRNSQSRSVNDTIGTLAENLAHIINNPLAIISTSTRILEKKSKEELVQEEVKSIKDSISRITSTTHSMKKLILTEDKMEISTFKIKNIQHAIELYFLNKFLESNIELIFDIEDDHTINACEYEINQVIFNLISNAIEEVKKIKSDDKKWIKVSSYIEGNNSILKIEDSGTGIEEDLIYDAMKSQDNSKIGLFSVTQLISKNLGKVRFSSSPNTTFTITLASHSLFDS